MRAAVAAKPQATKTPFMNNRIVVQRVSPGFFMDEMKCSAEPFDFRLFPNMLFWIAGVPRTTQERDL